MNDTIHVFSRDAQRSACARARAPLRVAAKRAIAWCIAVCALASPAHASERDHLPTVVSIELGFGGHYKLGCWTPLIVTLRGAKTTIHGKVTTDVPDGDGTLVHFSSEATELFAGQERDVTLYVKLGRTIDEVPIGVTLSPEPGSPSEPLGDFAVQPPLPEGDRLVVNLGPAVCPAEELAKHRTVLVEEHDCERLPGRWIGYEGVDALIVTTCHADLLTHLNADTGQLLAVEDWVAAGGCILVSGGGQCRVDLSPQSALGRIVPGTLGEMVELPRFDALENYTRVRERIPDSGRSHPELRQITRLDKPRGVVEVADGDLPLVVRAPQAFGQVVWLAVSLDRPPIANWSGRTALVAKLLDLPPSDDTPTSSSATASRATLHGIDDISGQLYAALDHFDGVRSLPFWVIVLVGLGYAVLVGPVDYWLVQRVFKRPELMWLTLPILVLVPALAVAAMSFEARHTSPQWNQLDLVDVDLEAKLERGTSWLSIYTPTAAQYTLAMEHGAPGIGGHNGEALSWFSPPGEGWGGMHAAAGVGSPLVEGYRISGSLSRIRNVTIEDSSARAFCARWSGEARPLLEVQLRATADGGLHGTLTNRLAVPLEPAVLLFGRWGYVLGKIEPDASIELAKLERRDVDAVLKQHEVFRSEKSQLYLQASKPYDPASIDLPTIVQTMMFYKIAGGRQYTGLADNQQAFVDFSHLVRLGRAVLVARSPGDDAAGAKWTDENEQQDVELHRHVWRRVVMPVEPWDEETRRD